MNQYTVIKAFDNHVAGETITADPAVGNKLARQGLVTLADEYVEKLVDIRWKNECLEIYNTQTGAVLLRIPGGGLTSLTLDIVGNLTGLYFGQVSTYIGDGAIAVTNKAAILNGADNTCAMTLADGIEGQEIIIKALDVTNACTVIPANFADGTTITFTDQYSAVRLFFDGTDWNIAETYLTVGVA